MFLARPTRAGIVAADLRAGTHDLLHGCVVVIAIGAVDMAVVIVTVIMVAIGTVIAAAHF